MGSMLKILGGAVQSRNEAKEAEAKRELIRDLQMKQADIEFQKAIFGDASDDPEATIFTRTTRRIIALIGMLNFATISILCTIYPTVELITFIPLSKPKKLVSCGVSIRCQSIRELQLQSQQGISPLSRLPLWAL